MRPVIFTLFLTMLFGLPVIAQQLSPAAAICPRDNPCKTDDQAPPQICNRYSGSLSFRPAEGPIQGSVLMQQWQIANDETAEIPHQGLLIVNLRAGVLVTEIEGERKQWREGSFWSVPAGKRLIVHTAGDSVVLQTVDFIIQ
ncbi:MAG TPA: hypothetical protein VF173_01340 [Thermoanaerobaculia bacterium]|nr:hypothetical protein [Thermoanaerobaculia bacterium]